MKIYKAIGDTQVVSMQNILDDDEDSIDVSSFYWVKLEDVKKYLNIEIKATPCNYNTVT